MNSNSKTAKGTWYRNFRARVLRQERLQRNSNYRVDVDNTAHSCDHCQAQFTGRYCPQCGKPAKWMRFTWSMLFLNFLDIWGFGNRPMFRTIKDLFWRPGYMLRDYLGGHHLSFFPPFKMLAVLTIILVFLIYIIGIKDDEVYAFAELLRDIFDKRSAKADALINLIDDIEAVLQRNILYRAIVMNIFVVVAVKLAFLKVSRLNLVETFFTQIYINCQFQILAIIILIFTGDIFDNAIFPYAVDELITIPILTYDFHQLYEIKWKTALGRTLLTCLYLILMLATVLAIVYLLNFI